MAHILLAEDHQSTANLTRLLLRQWGHTVVLASNGQEALELAWSNSFDLALLDVRMPLVDGFAVTEQVSNGLRVVGFTACADVETRQKLVALGAYDVVAKPFEALQLREAIERCLNSN